jgi:hypothetical protein
VGGTIEYSRPKSAPGTITARSRQDDKIRAKELFQSLHRMCLAKTAMQREGQKHRNFGGGVVDPHPPTADTSISVKRITQKRSSARSTRPATAPAVASHHLYNQQNLKAAFTFGLNSKMERERNYEGWVQNYAATLQGHDQNGAKRGNKAPTNIDNCRIKQMEKATMSHAECMDPPTTAKKEGVEHPTGFDDDLPSLMLPLPSPAWEALPLSDRFGLGRCDEDDTW